MNRNITNEEKCEIHQKYIKLLKKSNLLMLKGKGILHQNKEILNYISNINIKDKYEEEDLLSAKILFNNKKLIIHNLLNSSKRQGIYKIK